MYISKFSAFNYRSLKQVVVRFENGKNVIVGKNNSGKSNIIRGLEILVGEKFPTYVHITDNDFYTYEALDEETGEIIEVVADNLYLEVELEGRDVDEEMIKTIKKKTSFSKIKSSQHLYRKDSNGEVIINFDLFQNLDQLEDRDEIEVISRRNNNSEVKVQWKNANELLAFIKFAKIIKLFFCKSRTEEERNGYGIIVFDEQNNIWISHYIPKKLRDSLITTTVVSALRSQREDLRLVHYTWFGKLITWLWEKNKSSIDTATNKSYEELIKGKSTELKDIVDSVFDKDTYEIRSLLSGAISHKSVNFKFMNDAKNELYKNVQVFVNDGIDRPLNEKGTGIQSAIIISLFSLYCNYYHNNSSLLIAEEPELYLHPQARRVISAELNNFLDKSEDQQRQLIISTHSTDYLKNVDPYCITRVYKDLSSNCSIVKQLDSETSRQITIELKRFLWSNNTELFFADKVVLVEGGEAYLISAIVDRICQKKQLLDYENISIARVNGKGSFLTYIKMLQCFNISYLVLGDLDCFKDEVQKIASHLKLDEHKPLFSKVKTALSEMKVSYEQISERIKSIEKNNDALKLQSLFEKFSKGQITCDDAELVETLNTMKARATKGNRVSAILTKMNTEEYNDIHKILRDNSIFIWSKGDLEAYFTDRVINIRGTKDIRALELSYLIQNENESLESLLLHIDEITSLVDCILTRR